MILTMLMLFDFKCTDCNSIEEYLVQSDVKQVSCSHCDGRMSREVSPVRCKLEGTTGSFPGAALKWERQHEKAGRQPSETHPDGWK